MVTTLRISLGGGHASLNLDISRGSGPAARGRLGLLAVLLVAPLVLLIACQSLGSITGWYSVDQLMNAPRGPWVYLLTAATFGVLLAVVMLLVTRLRLVMERRDGVRQLTVTLRLTKLEAFCLGIGALLVALFVAHLVADGLACARGTQSAC